MATKLVNGERVELTAQEAAQIEAEGRKAAEARAAEVQQRADWAAVRGNALASVIAALGITEQQFKDAVKAAME